MALVARTYGWRHREMLSLSARQFFMYHREIIKIQATEQLRDIETAMLPYQEKDTINDVIQRLTTILQDKNVKKSNPKISQESIDLAWRSLRRGIQ